MGVTAIKPGILTTVQDRGRTGYLGSGFSPSASWSTRRAAHGQPAGRQRSPTPPSWSSAWPGRRFASPPAPTSPSPAATSAPRSTAAPRPCTPRLPCTAAACWRSAPRRRACTATWPSQAVPSTRPRSWAARSTNLKCGIGGWKGRALITGDYLPFCTRNIDFIPNLGSHTVDRDDAVLRLRRPRDHAARGARPAGGHVHARRRGHLLRPALHHHQPLRSHGIPPGRPGNRDGERQRHHLGRHRAGRCADPRRRPPHHHALRPPDHRRLRQDRHRLQRRPAQTGAVHAGARHPLRPVTIQQAQDLYRQEARRMDALAKMVKRPCYGGISPRRTARRLTPILEAQARAHASGSQKLWIELSKTEQQRLQPAEQPASESNR